MSKLHHLFIFAIFSHVLAVEAQDPANLIYTDSFESCIAGETVDWDGGGDSTSWFDELNWENDVLPADGDAVSLRRGGSDTVVYNSAQDSLRISCLDSSKALDFTGGSLEIDGHGWVASNVSVTAATLITTGHLTISGTLNQGSGTMSGIGRVTVRGVFTWTGGSQRDSGETVKSDAAQNRTGQTVTFGNSQNGLYIFELSEYFS